MSVLRPRNRLVYFRISEDEFRQLNDVCGDIGARSLSDLARTAVQRFITASPREDDYLSTRLRLLEATVNDLNSTVRQLLRSLTHSGHGEYQVGVVAPEPAEVQVGDDK
jgi:hypothetical protein